MKLLGLLCSSLSVVEGDPEKFFMTSETGKGHVLRIQSMVRQTCP